MSEVLKRKPKASKQLPPEVRLVGTIDGPVLIDAQHFGSPFRLTPQEFVINYGGSADPPPSEAEVTQAAANARNDEAINAYARSESGSPTDLNALRRHVAAEGRTPDTPEESFARDREDNE